MLAWKQLPFFIAVAREGSLRAGAELLGATHATTKRQIDALEARLGVRLMTRSRRGIILTEAGRRLLAEAQEAERHVTAAENRVRGLDREAAGKIRLTVEPLLAHALLTPILTTFAARHPQICLELRVGEALEDIAGQEADLALRYAPSPGPGVQARKLCPLTVATYASQAYWAGPMQNAGPRGEGLSWISYDDPEAPGRIAASAFPEADMRFCTTHLDLQLDLVRSGAGMAVLPTWVETCYPELRRLPGTMLETSRFIWLVINADLSRATRVRLFADHLTRALTAAWSVVLPSHT